MRNNDITKKVMNRVVQFEETRTSRWFKRYWIILFLLVIGIIYAGIRIYTGYQEFDEEFMVAWYFQDWELFQIVWRDALDFIWTLLPTYWVYGVGIGILGMSIVIFSTNTKRKNLKKKLQSIQTYKRR